MTLLMFSTSVAIDLSSLYLVYIWEPMVQAGWAKRKKLKLQLNNKSLRSFCFSPYKSFVSEAICHSLHLNLDSLFLNPVF